MDKTSQLGKGWGREKTAAPAGGGATWRRSHMEGEPPRG